MAKGKKNAELSLEERLEGALIPEWEQPHKIPQNWCWTNVKTLCDLINGRAFKPSDWSESGLPIVRIQNLNNPDADFNYFSGEVSPSHLLKGNELLFAWSGTPGTSFGAHIWWGNKAVLNQHIFKILFDEQLINKKFLKYAINQQLEWLISSAHGGAGLQHVTKGVFESTPIPLPPLAEQIRIADRIEHLFSKLDEAKEKAQAVVDGYEDRKAAILHKAFTGELTEKWRLAHAIKHNSWQKTTVGACSELITKGASPKWQGVSYTSDTTQTLFVTSENVREGFLDWSKEKFLDNAINDIQKRSVLHKGDVLVNIVGASIGRSAIFDRDCLANTNQAVCLVRVKDNLRNEYLCHYFNSPFALMYYDDNKVETARANISLTNISDMPINLPTLKEQGEIVRTLNEMIEREAAVKTTVEQVIDQIDAMKKSILARAFRGELGTNDPTDENAEELLKRILEEDV